MYDELRRVAGRYLGRERSNHTLQPTALVNEAWLRLQKDRGAASPGRTQGLALAAQAMRRVLIDHGRHQKSQKRGGRLPLSNSMICCTQPNGRSPGRRSPYA
jgi:RNA polymerase sigma factor (TIGR02999 family)